MDFLETDLIAAVRSKYDEVFMVRIVEQLVERVGQKYRFC